MAQGNKEEHDMKRNLGLLLLRAGAGTILMAHGYPKLFGGPEVETSPEAAKVLGPNFPEAVKSGGPASFAQALGSMGVPNPEVAAVASGLAEFGGGLALALGLLTKPAGLIVAGNMAVATRTAHWPQGLYGAGGYEFPALLGIVGAALAMTGPGAISIDHLFGRD
jgi:putative oxidoreductase